MRAAAEADLVKLQRNEMLIKSLQVSEQGEHASAAEEKYLS